MKTAKSDPVAEAVPTIEASEWVRNCRDIIARVAEEGGALLIARNGRPLLRLSAYPEMDTLDIPEHMRGMSREDLILHGVLDDPYDWEWKEERDKLRAFPERRPPPGTNRLMDATVFTEYCAIFTEQVESLAGFILIAKRGRPFLKLAQHPEPPEVIGADHELLKTYGDLDEPLFPDWESWPDLPLGMGPEPEK